MAYLNAQTMRWMNRWNPFLISAVERSAWLLRFAQKFKVARQLHQWKARSPAEWESLIFCSNCSNCSKSDWLKQLTNQIRILPATQSLASLITMHKPCSTNLQQEIKYETSDWRQAGAKRYGPFESWHTCITFPSPHYISIYYHINIPYMSF